MPVWEHIKEVAAHWVGHLDSLLFPDDLRCLCCDRALGDQQSDGLCPACAQALEKLEERYHTHMRTDVAGGLDYVSAVYPYEEQARGLILKLKFSRIRAAAVPLAAAMALLPGGEEELIVPMPTTKRRLRERGFNHARLLAQLIADELGMPLRDALTRLDDRPAQSTLTGHRRERNVEGCMRADASVRGKRVLLVDDVYTTGATAAEAARALLAAGATGAGLFCAAISTM